MMETIASWNSPLVVVQLLVFALLGGMPLGTLVLGLAGALPEDVYKRQTMKRRVGPGRKYTPKALAK